MSASGNKENFPYIHKILWNLLKEDVAEAKNSHWVL